jgi:CheY-like chemotaxis protein
MSGWEVAKKVKALSPNSTVILATGWGIKLDKEKLREAGINRVISKPFQVDEVLSCIDGQH